MVLRSLSFAMLATLLMSFGSSMCGAQAPPVQDTKTESATNGQAPAPQNPAAGPSSADASKQAQQALNAVDKAAPAVSRASDAVSKAGRYTKAIQDITGTTTRSAQPVTDNLQTLQATIEAIQQNNVVSTLNAALKEIDATQSDSLEAAVKDACDTNKLKQPASGNQQDVTDALAKCAASQKDAATTLATVTPALTALQKAMQSISPYLATQFHSLADKLKPFVDAKLISSDSTGTPSAAVLLQVLPKGLPALQQVVSSMGEYKSAWSSMKPTLSANAGTASTTADKKDDSSSTAAPLDPDTELKKLQDSVDAIESKLAGWLGIIATQLNTDSQTLDGKLSGVASDPAKTSAEALGLVRDESATLATAQTIVDNWPPLVGFLVDGQPAGFSVATARKSLEDLQKASNTLRVSISRLQDAVAGDFTDFETDQVSLYYFSDIPRLMYALNNGFQTMGGVAEAKAQADAQRTALTQAELDLADAQATVNRYQKQVLDLQEQQRQANEKLKGLNANLSKLASHLQHAQTDKQNADGNYQNALTDQNNSKTSTTSASGTPTTSPADPTLAANVDKAKAKQTADAAKLSNAQSNYDAAKTERDNAQAKADDAQNQKDSIPAKLAAAQQSLSDAQTAVSQQRRKMLLAAQAESDAFAFARDNTPFLFAAADASSLDPAKRVILYAFNDSKTIFMRGKRKDLELVKRMIYEFDKPAPQARLTLWTFQLSADSAQKTNKDAAKRLNESMEIVDQELSDTRALENTTLTLLRDLINEAVVKLAALPPPNPPGQDCRLDGGSPADCRKLRRVIQFYDPAVLQQLNFDMSVPDLSLLRGLIPDPAGTTTLGEALLVLSLARPVTKNCVHSRFENEIRGRLAALPVAQGSQQGTIARDLLPLTWQALDVWEAKAACEFDAGELGPTPTVALSSSQLEIVKALRASYDSKLLREILNKMESWRVELGGRATHCPATRPTCPADAGLYFNLDDVKGRISDYVDRGLVYLRKQSPLDAAQLSALIIKPGPPSHDDTIKRMELAREAINLLPVADQIAYDDLDRERLSLESRLETIKKQSVEVVKTLRAYGIDAGDFLPSTAIPGSSRKSDASAGPTASASSAVGTASQAAVQSVEVVQQSIEAAKQRILNYRGLSTTSPRVAAADEMLKELIIAVEDDLSREFVQPMITRLRTRLMTQSKVGVGIIQRESMLATNRGVARIDPRASAQLAVGEQEDILTGIQQLAQLYATVQSGGALAALGALQQQPREPQPEIYALSTGNKFQVTPIFDPSGQALRFKFDFVATSNLQEPNGTTNPQLSRIERHTINTEVQLSNLETREISRFEVNARLGLPTTYWGGVPVLKDIPYVRPWVPLIGWFVRKGGSNASAQQSVIFGQTTIYPTIGALVDLVSDPGVPVN